MLYLNESHINQIGIAWYETIDIIEQTVRLLAQEDFSQPLKPYLRYRDLKNRIIAMPAFIGGDFNMAGIKWIASFPNNIEKGLARAHSVVILNNADTGEPVGIINTPLLSIIRTASVSGLIIKYFERVRPKEKLNLGIIGWGPIGQYHLRMCETILKGKITTTSLYDTRKLDVAEFEKNRLNIKIVDSWEEVYLNSDFFITCTVAKESYINKKPKDSSLHLNVSLRDYCVETYEYFKNSVIVDEWEEVCRENTDIENMHKSKGLQKADTKSIIDIIISNCLEKYEPKQPVMFNPMGMAVFDIAIATYYFDKANKLGIGNKLE